MRETANVTSSSEAQRFWENPLLQLYNEAEKLIVEASERKLGKEWRAAKKDYLVPFTGGPGSEEVMGEALEYLVHQLGIISETDEEVVVSALPKYDNFGRNRGSKDNIEIPGITLERYEGTRRDRFALPDTELSVDPIVVIAKPLNLPGFRKHNTANEPTRLSFGHTFRIMAKTRKPLSDPRFHGEVFSSRSITLTRNQIWANDTTETMDGKLVTRKTTAIFDSSNADNPEAQALFDEFRSVLSSVPSV